MLVCVFRGHFHADLVSTMYASNHAYLT